VKVPALDEDGNPVTPSQTNTSSDPSGASSEKGMKGNNGYGPNSSFHSSSASSTPAIFSMSLPLGGGDSLTPCIVTLTSGTVRRKDTRSCISVEEFVDSTTGITFQPPVPVTQACVASPPPPVTSVSASPSLSPTDVVNRTVVAVQATPLPTALKTASTIAPKDKNAILKSFADAGATFLWFQSVLRFLRVLGIYSTHFMAIALNPDHDELFPMEVREYIYTVLSYFLSGAALQAVIVHASSADMISGCGFRLLRYLHHMSTGCGNKWESLSHAASLFSELPSKFTVHSTLAHFNDLVVKLCNLDATFLALTGTSLHPDILVALLVNAIRNQNVRACVLQLMKPSDTLSEVLVHLQQVLPTMTVLREKPETKPKAYSSAPAPASTTMSTCFKCNAPHRNRDCPKRDQAVSCGKCASKSHITECHDMFHAWSAARPLAPSVTPAPPVPGTAPTAFFAPLLPPPQWPSPLPSSEFSHDMISLDHC
jgi:hypothetical protein